MSKINLRRLSFEIINDIKLRLESRQTGWKATDSEQREKSKRLKFRWETEETDFKYFRITAKMTIFARQKVKRIEGRNQDDSKDFGMERQCSQ